MKTLSLLMSACFLAGMTGQAPAAEVRTASFPVLKAFLDQVPAIDTHDHLWKWEDLPGWREAEDGTRIMNLASIWQNSYLNGFRAVPAWQSKDKFADWWQRAKSSFANALAVFPGLKARLWRDKQAQMLPP